MNTEDGHISDATIWEIRDKLEPPMEGYVMFSSSGWEENVEYLVENRGMDESDICLVRYGDYVSCWIPKEGDEQ